MLSQEAAILPGIILLADLDSIISSHVLVSPMLRRLRVFDGAEQIIEMVERKPVTARVEVPEGALT
jgi:hypothetical protein